MKLAPFCKDGDGVECGLVCLLQLSSASWTASCQRNMKVFWKNSSEENFLTMSNLLPFQLNPYSCLVMSPLYLILTYKLTLCATGPGTKPSLQRLQQTGKGLCQGHLILKHTLHICPGTTNLWCLIVFRKKEAWLGLGKDQWLVKCRLKIYLTRFRTWLVARFQTVRKLWSGEWKSELNIIQD